MTFEEVRRAQASLNLALYYTEQAKVDLPEYVGTLDATHDVLRGIYTSLTVDK